MSTKPNPLGDRWPTDVGGQDSFQIKRGRIIPRQEFREVIESALADRSIFFVDNEDHATDFYRRQARGSTFEVRLVDADGPTPFIARITIELDRVEND